MCLKGGLGPGDLLCLAPAWVLAASVIIGALVLAIGLVALARSRPAAREAMKPRACV